LKEAYAVRRTVPPSAEIQASIDELLSKGMVDDPQKMLSELARLGARLIIQRAVEDEFDTWLGRARYERKPEAGPGKRNGFRPRHVQTAEGELRIEIPQVREAGTVFVSKLFHNWHCERLLRTDPLKALIVGGFVRGLSMRDVESLCEEAGLGRTSKSTVATICAELHDRFEAFCRRSLYDVKLVVLFLDAIYLPVRPSGPREGVMCAWGITEDGRRALVSVRLGMREAKEDWLELGRDLTSRGLAAPRLVVADGAPGVNLGGRRDLAARRSPALRRSSPQKPQGQAAKVRPRARPVQLLGSAHRRDLGQRRQAPPEGPHLRARARRLPRCRQLPRRRPRRPGRAPALPAQTPRTLAVNEPAREIARRGQTTDQGDGPIPGEASCLSLVWAVLDLLFSHASNGATLTELDRQHLYRIKFHQADPDTLDEEVTAA
jgi:hypothetical protein